MNRIAIVFLLLASCSFDTRPVVGAAGGGAAGGRANVVADVEALTSCWDTPVVGTSGGFPPFDVMVAAVAMRQWVGGSWKPCTCNPGLTLCTCPRLIGAGRIESKWNGCYGGSGGTCNMTSTNYLDGSQSNWDRSEAVFATDWDDDVFEHASTVDDDGYVGGSILVTLLSSASNTWNVHHCIHN